MPPCLLSPELDCKTGMQGRLLAGLLSTLMGVVKQEVKTSAGKSGFWGSISFAPHAASRMPSSKLPSDPCLPGSDFAASCTGQNTCSTECRVLLSKILLSPRQV